jgi:hypothetical protein
MKSDRHGLDTTKPFRLCHTDGSPVDPYNFAQAFQRA